MLHPRAGRWKAPPVAVIASVVSAGVLTAHDFWIVPDAFQIVSGGTMDVRGQTSTKFPSGMRAVTPERVAEARLVGAGSDERLTDLSTGGKSLLIRHRPKTPGQRIVAVALVPRSSRTTPERLKRYIALEGAPALELVPVNDPSLHAGDTLVERLLYHGQPVVGAHLHAGAMPHGVTATSDSAQAAVPAGKDSSVETGSDGAARIAVGEHGLWNVRTLHAATGANSAWEVYFATLVFSVAGKGGL